MTTRSAICRLIVHCLLVAAVIHITMEQTSAEPEGYNYDESKVPVYTLPDALTCLDGSKVTTPTQWKSKRRAELLKLFTEQVYGRTPSAAVTVREELVETTPALNGLATRKQVRLVLENNGVARHIDVLMYLPANAPGHVPAFLGLNFQGNHTISADPAIRLPDTWVEPKPAAGLTNNRATDKMRGFEASLWQVEKIIARGYGVVTAYRGDIFPDHPNGLAESVIPLFQKELAPGDWNALGAWAWALSRLYEYLERGRDVDVRRLVLIGHSRLGKAALWAGAQDERFGIVISNNSGEGGAALARRCFGETTKRVNTSFPQWFCGNFKQYSDKEASMPVDAHELLSLIAPRPLYVASAADDLWADPKGEFLSAKIAGEVYALLGKKGVGVAEQPPVNTPVGEDVAYHIRTGKHDVTAYDWDQYLNFADRHFGSPNLRK